MDLERGTGSWRKFFVLLSGETNGAHSALVAKFKSIGQIEVSSVEESNYILLFCPIHSASQLWTELSEALGRVTVEGDKRIVLVAMHLSSGPDHVMANSRRQVNNSKVHLVVDFVFDEGRLLDCNRNHTAWHEIKTFLKISQGTNENVRENRLCTTKRIIAFIIGFVIGLVAVIVATQLT